MLRLRRVVNSRSCVTRTLSLSVAVTVRSSSSAESTQRRVIDLDERTVVLLPIRRAQQAEHRLVNAKIVSERLSHHSVAFTLDTYAHVMPGMQAVAVSCPT